MSGYVIRTAVIVWETCPKCGHAFPNAYPSDDNGNPLPDGKPVGHVACRVTAPKAAPPA